MASCHHCQKIKNKKVRGNVYMHRKKKSEKCMQNLRVKVDKEFSPDGIRLSV